MSMEVESSDSAAGPASAPAVPDVASTAAAAPQPRILPISMSAGGVTVNVHGTLFHHRVLLGRRVDGKDLLRVLRAQISAWEPH